MILRFFAFANRIDHYSGNLKKFLNDFMGKYVTNDAVGVTELGALFRRTMQNVYNAFGENAARLYSDDEGSGLTAGKWESKFSISALDIQASALVGHAPAKVLAAAEYISAAYKFYLATNPQVRLAISRRPASADATKTRWFGFKTIVHEILNNTGDSDMVLEPLSEARALFKTGYYSAAGAVAGVALERHLKELCANLDPRPTTKGDTIHPLNEALKSACVYDQTQSRRIQVMADIRNRCGHSVSNPPSNEEILELINGVVKFMNDYPVRK